MREQKANDNGFPVVGKQAKEQQIFPFEQLVEYDGTTNKITINANLTINGDTNIGELDIDSGDAPKGQVLTANGQSGASWGFPSMERIVDANDNFRFVEGAITMQTITGITQTYGKWSLSGTHLMIVLAGKIENESTISGTLAYVNLPNWVLNKIIPLVANLVSSKDIILWSETYSTQSIGVNIRKETNRLTINIGNITLTAERYFRIEFDLLIDAE